jgi:hypothetical protein
MLRAVREGGQVAQGADLLLALAGIDHPTPEQSAGALVLAFGLHDLHTIARAHVKGD